MGEKLFCSWVAESCVCSSDDYGVCWWWCWVGDGAAELAFEERCHLRSIGVGGEFGHDDGCVRAEMVRWEDAAGELVFEIRLWFTVDLSGYWLTISVDRVVLESSVLRMMIEIDGLSWLEGLRFVPYCWAFVFDRTAARDEIRCQIVPNATLNVVDYGKTVTMWKR